MRYLGLPVEGRICELYGGNVEDEIHFLVLCPSLDNVREALWKKIDSLNKHFQLLSGRDNFIWLLSSEDKDLILTLYNLFSVLDSEDSERQ